GRRWRRRLPRGLRDRHPPAPSGVQTRLSHHLRRLRRAHPRSSGKSEFDRIRLFLGHQKIDGNRRYKRERTRHLIAGRRLRFAGIVAVSGSPRDRADAWLENPHIISTYSLWTPT